MPHFGSGFCKNILTSLAVLLLVVLLAIKNEQPTGLSIQLIDNEIPSIVDYAAEIGSRAAGYVHGTNSTLLLKRADETYPEGKKKDWSQTIDPNYPVFGNSLNDAFTALGIDGSTAIIKHHQNEDAGRLFPANGGPAVITQPTTARFENAFFPVSGTIIADANNSPAGLSTPEEQWFPYDVNNPNRFPGEPPISQIFSWSDAAYLQWLLTCQETSPPTNIRNVRHMIRVGVDNIDTKTQIYYPHHESKQLTIGGTYATATTFSKTDGNPGPFRALLGSKNGAGCAFFLIDHKVARGVKDITSIKVWHPLGAVTLGAQFNFGAFRPSMLLTVEDVVLEPEGGPAGV